MAHAAEGAPELRTTAGEPSPSWSVSIADLEGATALALWARAGAAVGVDLERIGPRRLVFAGNFSTAVEARAVAPQPVVDRDTITTAA